MDLIRIANRVECVNYWSGLGLNILLVYLILNVRRSEVAYKYLQLSFVLNDILYATISFALGDKMITKSHTFAMFLTSPYGNNLHLVCLFGSMFSVILVVVSFNFLYRYWAVVNPPLVRLFSTVWFPLCLGLLTLTVFGVWYATCFFLYVATDEGRAFVAPEFARKYGLDSRTHAIVMADYYRNGHYDPRPIAGICVFLGIITASVAFMVFCMVSILRHLSRAKAISTRTKKLQYALFRTLTVQTIVPVVFLHGTAGNTILLPLFGVDISMFCDWISVSCSCFPPFDAIATILLQRDYRETVKAMLFCRTPPSSSLKSSTSVVQKISIITDSDAKN